MEQTMSANAYQDELLGLMALHLILLSMNKVALNLEGSVHIYYECLEALDQMEHLNCCIRSQLAVNIPTFLKVSW